MNQLHKVHLRFLHLVNGFLPHTGGNASSTGQTVLVEISKCLSQSVSAWPAVTHVVVLGGADGGFDSVQMGLDGLHVNRMLTATHFQNQLLTNQSIAITNVEFQLLPSLEAGKT